MGFPTLCSLPVSQDHVAICSDSTNNLLVGEGGTRFSYLPSMINATTAHWQHPRSQLKLRLSCIILVHALIHNIENKNPYEHNFTSVRFFLLVLLLDLTQRTEDWKSFLCSISQSLLPTAKDWIWVICLIPKFSLNITGFVFIRWQMMTKHRSTQRERRICWKNDRQMYWN